jgi:transcriptional regulator
MYTPKAFLMEDRAELVAFMRAHSFATLVSCPSGALIATHLPVVIEDDGSTITISGHVARQNPHVEAFDGRTPSLVIFTGPHGYVPATVYEATESVPTWNYIAVHATGVASAVSLTGQRPEVDDAMHSMVSTYDPGYHAQYAALSDHYREGMLRGIVVFSLTVTQLEGKAKLSQNRNPHDQAAIEAHLLAHADPAARATGESMRSRRTPP